MHQISNIIRGVRLPSIALVLALLGAPVASAQQTRRLQGRAIAFKPQCASDPSCEAWAQFRTGHPYPYQSIQWKELPDHRMAIMLLEPPPVMAKAEMEKLVHSAFGGDIESFQRFRWQMGIDGWLEDTVLTLAGPITSDPLKDPLLRDRIAFLHLLLFGTSFGATFDLQKDRLFATPSEAPPSLRISPGEVRRWMTDATLRWQTLADAPYDTVAWQSIAGQRQTGAFIASDRSLVLLTFPGEILKKAPVDEGALNPLRVPFRCFAMASDSIAGAFQATNGQIAILGRPRTQSVASVPPLRFETFKLLASQTSDELSQSYERRSVFAGKMLSGEYIMRDWAPIYLSDALIDTEFGALLNTTDQLLKSWSQAGTIEYLHFNYPKPPVYPFKTALSTKVKTDSGSNSVLFNWNTAGSAVIVNSNVGNALGVRETGALPVTYGAGLRNLETDQLLVDEETAYKYFAERRDANLERVVQYTLLYQFFRMAGGYANEKLAKVSEPPGQERAVRARREAAAVRVKATLKLLADVEAGRIRMDAKEKEEFASKLRRFRLQNPALATDSQIASIVADRFSDESKKLSAARKSKLLAAIAEVDGEIDEFNRIVRNGNSRFALPLSSDRPVADLPVIKKDIEKKEQALKLSQQDNPIEDVRNILISVAEDRPELDEVRRGFVESYRYEPAGSIKTPSIVVSWDSESISLVGGHNIGARALKMEVSTNVSGISLVDTENGKVLRYNPSKASSVEAHATELARAVEHGHVTNVADLESIIAPAVPVRSRMAALKLPKAASTGSAPDAWSARLGNRVFTAKSQFVDKLAVMSETSACCEFVAYDEAGTAFATERSPHPPPVTITYELRDTPSLTAHIEGAAKRGRPLVFLDTPEAHVEAISLQATVENGNTRGLNEMAAWLGKGHSAVREARMDGIAATDLNGSVGFLKTLANKADAGARALLNRLTLREPATSWVQAEVKRMDVIEVNNIVRQIGWDAEKDGIPAAVMVKFGAADANGPPIDVSVVAGFAQADLPAGRNALYAIHEKSIALTRAKRESLARYALTVKSEMQRLPQARAKRLAVVVRRGKTKQLLSMREWQDWMVTHAATHAG